MIKHFIAVLYPKDENEITPIQILDKAGGQEIGYTQIDDTENPLDMIRDYLECRYDTFSNFTYAVTLRKAGD